MSRAIRLNSSAGGIAASSSASGLSSSEVKTLIAQNSEWVLDYQTSYTSAAPTYPLSIISSVDFDNVQAYRVILRNFGTAQAGYLKMLIWKNGSTPVTGTNQWSYQYYYNADPYQSQNTTFSGHELQLSAGQYDSIEGSNWREITIWINKSDSPNDGRRYLAVQNINGIPETGGYQNYRIMADHQVLMHEDFDALGLSFNNGTPTSPSSKYGDSNIYVYKKLRAPAS